MRFPAFLAAAVMTITACGSDPIESDAPGTPEPAEASGAEGTTRTQTGAAEDPGQVAASCGTRIDADANEVIARTEYVSFSGFAFDNWNLDRDESLSLPEFHRCWRALGWGDATSAFTRFDQDDDGALTPDEFFRIEAFQAWDHDDSSSLEPDEWPPRAG